MFGPHSVHRPVMPCLDRVDGTAVLKSSIDEGRELILHSGVMPWLPAIACEDVCGLVIASRHRIHDQLPRPAIAADEVLRTASWGDPVERSIARPSAGVGLRWKVPAGVRFEIPAPEHDPGFGGNQGREGRGVEGHVSLYADSGYEAGSRGEMAESENLPSSW